MQNAYGKSVAVDTEVHFRAVLVKNRNRTNTILCRASNDSKVALNLTTTLAITVFQLQLCRVMLRLLRPLLAPYTTKMPAHEAIECTEKSNNTRPAVILAFSLDLKDVSRMILMFE